MKNYYYHNNRENYHQEYLKKLDLHIPQWMKQLVEIYKSPLKYKISRESENYRR